MLSMINSVSFGGTTLRIWFHLTEDHFGTLDARARRGPYVQFDPSSVNGKEKVSADEGQQHESRRHDCDRCDQSRSPVLQNRLKRARVAVSNPEVVLIKPLVDPAKYGALRF